MRKIAMNMPLTVALLFIFSLVSRADETNALPTKIKIGDETYEDVTWGTVTPATVKIRDKSGVAAIALEKLPPELQTRFGYDPKKAAEFRAAEAVQRQEAERQAAEVRRKQGEATRAFESKMSTLTAEENAAKVKRQAQLAEIEARKPIDIYVKDVKNFPEKYEGKPVRVICNINRFQRVDFGEFDGHYQLDVDGLALYRSSYSDKPVLD